MPIFGLRPVILAATVAAFVAPFLSSPASAQAIDREKAWAECIALVDRSRPPTGDGSNQSERVAAFKACMAAKGIRP